MNKPTNLDGIKYLGQWFWVEIEGYEDIVRLQSGNFAFIEKKIMGWECETLGDIFERQQKEKAPRVRFWACEEKPSAEERAKGEWWNECRVWMPLINEIYDPVNRCYHEDRWEQFCNDGTCHWDD